MHPDPTPPPQPPFKGGGTPRRGRDPFPGKLKGTGFGPGHLKIESLLAPQHLDEYRALIRQPRTTHDAAHAWLRERGYEIGRSAVRRHLEQFRQRVEAVRQAAEMSHACAELTRETGTPVLADGSVGRFETLLSQALFAVEAGGALDRKHWDMLGRALTSAVNNRARVEELRRSFEDARRAAAKAAEAAAKGGADATTVVDRVKEILGV